jgi:hypothetical protein
MIAYTGSANGFCASILQAARACRQTAHTAGAVGKKPQSMALFATAGSLRTGINRSEM